MFENSNEFLLKYQITSTVEIIIHHWELRVQTEHIKHRARKMRWREQEHRKSLYELWKITPWAMFVLQNKSGQPSEAKTLLVKTVLRSSTFMILKFAFNIPEDVDKHQSLHINLIGKFSRKNFFLILFLFVFNTFINFALHKHHQTYFVSRECLNLKFVSLKRWTRVWQKFSIDFLVTFKIII